MRRPRAHRGEALARKKRRQQQQHQGQRSTRQRSYRIGNTAPSEIYKPGFPMNILTNTKVFVIIGLGVMVGGLVVASVLGASGIDQGRTDVPATATPESADEDDATPEATATPPIPQYGQAEDVIDEEANDYSATITTEKGTIELDLFEQVAPNTVNSFVFLAGEGFFDNLAFHRVDPNFVVQAGDPFSSVDLEEDYSDRLGTGGPGYQTEEEPNEIRNEEGMVSMAKAGGASAFGSQFFINLKDNPALDYDGTGDSFYPFAEVTEGMDVVQSLEQGDVIESIEITEEPR